MHAEFRAAYERSQRQVDSRFGHSLPAAGGPFIDSEDRTRLSGLRPATPRCIFKIDKWGTWERVIFQFSNRVLGRALSLPLFEASHDLLDQSLQLTGILSLRRSGRLGDPPHASIRHSHPPLDEQ